MMMIVKQSVECELAGETEVLGEKLSQRNFVHHKSHMTWPGLEPGPLRLEAGDYPPELRHGLNWWLRCAKEHNQKLLFISFKAAFLNLWFATMGQVVRKQT
jgi:hypothetical protein